MSITDDGSKVISQFIKLKKSSKVNILDESFILDRFDIFRILKIISSKKNITTIGLQFPNHLLQCAYTVVKLFEKNCKNKIIKFLVLGDNIHSSCCVDIITADHLKCNLIVQYEENACLSKIVQSIPVIHVFGKIPKSFDVKLCANELIKFSERDEKSKCMVIFDLKYYSIIEKLQNFTQTKKNIFFAKILSNRVIQHLNEEENEEEKKKAENEKIMFGLSFRNYKDIKRIFYIGKSSFKCVQFVLEFSVDEFSVFDGENNKFYNENSEFFDARRLLKKRYYLMNLAKCANVIGIVISTATIKSYQKMVNYCKNLIKGRGRKCFVFYMSKVTPEKLANFTEIDIFVLVNCSQNSIINANDYYKPIITPYELYIALNSKDWLGDYVSDFTELLKMTEKDGKIKEVKKETDFSFITNSMVSISGKEDVSDRRNWKGLDPSINEEVGEIEEGLDGTGEKYTPYKEKK